MPTLESARGSYYETLPPTPRKRVVYEPRALSSVVIYLITSRTPVSLSVSRNYIASEFSYCSRAILFTLQFCSSISLGRIQYKVLDGRSAKSPYPYPERVLRKMALGRIVTSARSNLAPQLAN